MIVIACGSTSQERLQYSGRPYPACLPDNETAVIAHAATQGRKTPFKRKERTTYSPYKDKVEMVQNILGKSVTSNKTKKEKRKKHNMWLSGCLYIEGRLNEGLRLQRKHKDESKQSKTNVTPEKTSWHLQNKRPEDTSSCHLWLVNKARASEPARARLLWAILSLVLPVTFGHTIACRSSGLAFSATIQFIMKCSASCSAVLRHSLSSWAAAKHPIT